ncbi:MAG: glutamate--tRNA ligase [Firmicutes bacterium]|nr:glutamate--tRNA ligase [Bacillota bacterium]
MEGEIRARFAPSPTGLLHIGNVHTAIFTWLFVRHNQGKFILRIEDTDRSRSTQEYEEMLLDDLAWLGLDWDEGVDVGGPYGPYRQTERMELYRHYAQKLLAEGWAYECYCSQEELEAERARAVQEGRAPRYSGRCRKLTDEEREAYRKVGRRPVIRFKTPPGEQIVVKDLIRGEITFNTSDLDDFIIVRSNGMPLYNFAVTIDDLTMKISHIVRADEHISNTPRQLLIYRALGETPPVFAHVSMLLGPDRSKLSKRHGATSLREYREKGYLPDAIFNYLAILGWSLPDDREFATREELIRLFDLTRVSRAPAVFDPEKAAWMNGVYIRQMDLDTLTDLALPFFQKAGQITADRDVDRQWLQGVIDLVRDGVTSLSQLPAAAELFFEAEPSYEEQALAVLQKEGVREVLVEYRERIPQWPSFDPETVATEMKRVPKDLGLSVGKALRPLRAALTGRVSGPELNYIVSLLGKEAVLARLEYVINNLLT